MKVRSEDLPCAAAGQAGDRPGGVTEDLQRDVVERRAVGGGQFGDGHDEGPVGPFGSGEDLDDGDPRALTGRARSCAGRLTQLVAPVHDEHGRLDVHALGDVDEDRVGCEGVVEPHQRVAALLHGPERLGRSGHVVGPPEIERRHPSP